MSNPEIYTFEMSVDRYFKDFESLFEYFKQPLSVKDPFKELKDTLLKASKLLVEPEHGGYLICSINKLVKTPVDEHFIVVGSFSKGFVVSLLLDTSKGETLSKNLAFWINTSVGNLLEEKDYLLELISGKISDPDSVEGFEYVLEEESLEASAIRLSRVIAELNTFGVEND